MPETTIGFFPDVGASHFLHRLAPGVGLLLGLTGASLSGPAVFLAGAATHYVAARDVGALKAALCDSGDGGSCGDADHRTRDFAAVDELLRGFAAQIDGGERRKFDALAAIAARCCVGARCVPDVVAALRADPGDRVLCDSMLAALDKCVPALALAVPVLGHQQCLCVALAVARGCTSAQTAHFSRLRACPQTLHPACGG